MLDGGGLAALVQNAPFGLALADLERIAALPAAALQMPADAHVLAPKPQGHVIAHARWHALRETALAALAAFHAGSPEEPGVEITRLRRMAAPAISDQPWRALIEELIAEQQVARNGPWLHLPAHRVVVSAEEAALAGRLMPLVAGGGYDPPWVRDLAETVAATESAVRQTLRKLARQGVVHQVVPDLFYAAERMRELAAIVAQIVGERGDVAAAEFRDRAGTGRKRAVQILEFFDRVGYTRRVHDAHRLRGEREGFF